jgi:agmatinase
LPRPGNAGSRAKMPESNQAHTHQAGPFQPPWNFLGLPEELASPERARVWVLPIPYECTTCYGGGTRNGSAAIIAASRQVERFDREFDCEPSARLGVHTMSPLGPVRRSPEAMVEAIEAAVAGVLQGPGFRVQGSGPATRHPPPATPDLLAVLGGEHTISVGVVRGLARARGADDLVAVQIDAHGDLHDQYEGSPYSHACAARRIVETCPLFQIGIRNTAEAEERFRRQSNRVRTVFAEEAMEGAEVGGRWNMVGGDPTCHLPPTTYRLPFLRELAEFVRGKTVFLTIDLDGLDPSIMPAVGTPEPGGLSWARTLEVVRVVCGEAARVPVFDVVELAPIAGLSAPDFLAARLVYKIMALALLKK